MRIARTPWAALSPEALLLPPVGLRQSPCASRPFERMNPEVRLRSCWRSSIMSDRPTRQGVAEAWINRIDPDCADCYYALAFGRPYGKYRPGLLCAKRVSYHFSTRDLAINPSGHQRDSASLMCPFFLALASTARFTVSWERLASSQPYSEPLRQLHPEVGHVSATGVRTDLTCIAA